MKTDFPFLGSTARHASAAFLVALVAAAALDVAPTPASAADSTASEIEARVEGIERSLVTVSVTGDARAPVPDNDLFGEFFHRFGGREGLPDMPFGRNRGASSPENVAGTGVVIGGEGLIVTAAPILAYADRVEIETHDGRTLPADVVGRDAVSGLALLRAEATDLPVAEWSAEPLFLGQNVYTLGRSGTYGAILSSGVVGATTPDGEVLLDDEAAPALLGAPIVDEAGRILAIRTREGDPASGMVAAIAAEAARGLVDELADRGAVARGFLGVGIQPVTADLATALGLDRPRGAIVAEVGAGTPAETAGLEPGDVILSLDGETIEGPAALSRAVGTHDPGDEVRLSVLRDGDEMTIGVTLAALPGDEATAEATGGGTPVPELGVSLQSLTPALREAFDLSESVSGLVVTEVADDAAGDLQTGDVIVSLYRDAVETVEDVQAAAQKAQSEGRSSLLVLVDRDGARIFIPVPLAAG